MGAAHGHRLHYHGHSLVHRLPAHLKILALLGFVCCVVATPQRVYWPYAGYALGLLFVLVVSRVPPGFIARRMVIELPFVVFAVLMPLIASGPRIDVWVLSLSVPGLHAAAALLCKGTLGVAASLLLASTTEPRDLLAGLQRLRLPNALVQIMAFMIRYLDVATAEMRRMRIARQSRCFSERGVRSWPTVARSGGVLFIRSYERGERVHLAMLSRGYTGSLPSFDVVPPRGREWVAAAALPLLAGITVTLGWVSVAS